jgi:ATP-binding cassette subfamily B protein
MKNKKENKNKGVDYKYNLSVYFSFLKDYKFWLVGMLLVSLIVESTFIANNFLFKKIVDNGTAFAAGSSAKSAFVGILFVIIAAFLGLIIARYIFNWLFIHIINRLESRLILDLKKRYFNHIIHLSHGFHTSHKTGSLISRLIRGGGSMERMTDVIAFNISPLVFQFAVASASLIYFDWVSALIIALTVISFIGFSLFMQFVSQKSQDEANEQEDIEKANISDLFTNIESIKYFGKENIIKNKFAKLVETTKQKFLKNWDYYKWTASGQGLILGIGTLFLVYFPVKSFLAGNLSLGTLTFIYTTFGVLSESLFSFVYGLRNFYRAMVDFDDLFQYGKIENEIKDKPNALQTKIEKGEIMFDKIWFAYDKRIIFQGLSLKIPEGKKVALVGHSGSGKSTLVKLLYRLYDVNSGSITVDNKDIRDFKQEFLRGEMSIVPQECVLFDDTIYNNIAFSKPNARKEEVLQAIKFAQLDKIIKDFPNKESTIVGERGIKLSGGEKQRVSIARAILADKKILVLDEATSSLDSKTEFEIQSALKELMKGRTTIIIAHRLSTIMNADNIVVMQKGKIVQQGNHNKLIKQEGEYKKLWEMQKGGYIK